MHWGTLRKVAFPAGARLDPVQVARLTARATLPHGADLAGPGGHLLQPLVWAGNLLQDLKPARKTVRNMIRRLTDALHHAAIPPAAFTAGPASSEAAARRAATAFIMEAAARGGAASDCRAPGSSRR